MRTQASLNSFFFVKNFSSCCLFYLLSIVVTFYAPFTLMRLVKVNIVYLFFCFEIDSVDTSTLLLTLDKESFLWICSCKMRIAHALFKFFQQVGIVRY